MLQVTVINSIVLNSHEYKDFVFCRVPFFAVEGIVASAVAWLDLARRSASVVCHSAVVQLLSVSSDSCGYCTWGNRTTSRELPGEHRGNQNLKLVFDDFFSTPADVANVLVGDDLCGKDVTLMWGSARVDLITIYISTHTQSAGGDRALAQACWDPTVCTCHVFSALARK